jgi:hypothetical protein
MTILEYLLAMTFVSLGLAPLSMTVLWERRLRALERRADAAESRAGLSQRRASDTRARP